MQQCLIYLKKIFFSDPYRKSIWFFITLWILTFLFSDEISYSGLYYLILLVATIVLLFEKCEIIDNENAIRKRFFNIFLCNLFSMYASYISCYLSVFCCRDIPL